MREILDSLMKRTQRNEVDVCLDPSRGQLEFHTYPCAVCGQLVDRLHPLHRKERPDRSDPPVVVL